MQGNQPLFQWTQAGLSSLQTEIEAWVTKEKGYHEVVKEKETSWMSNVQPSVVKPHGVSPKSFDGQYAWANEGANIVSVDEHTALYHAQLVIAAYAKAEGRCFWLLVTEQMKRKTSPAQAKLITPTIVKARVMISLETLLDEQLDEFLSKSEAYVSDYIEFTKWFAARAKLQKNNTESDNAFYQRVQYACKEAERMGEKKSYYYVVKYVQFSTYGYATLLTMLAFRKAYPEWGLHILQLKAGLVATLNREDLCVMPALDDIDGRPREGYIKLWVSNREHFFLLRERTEKDNEPCERSGRGRPATTHLQQNEANHDELTQTTAIHRPLTEMEHKQEIQNNENRFLETLEANELSIHSDREHPFTEDDLHKFRLQLMHFFENTYTFKRCGTPVTDLKEFFKKEPLYMSADSAKRMDQVRSLVHLAGEALDPTSIEFVDNLFHGGWMCKYCRGDSFKSGSVMVFNKQTIDRHLESETHENCRKESLKNQSIRDALVRQSATASNLSMNDLIEAALTSHFITCGVRPYMIPKLLTKEIIELIMSLRSGMHSVKASNETVLARAGNVMRDFMKHDFADVPLSIIADSVLTQNNGGEEVLFVYASSPVLVGKLKESSPDDVDGTGEVLLDEYHYTSTFSSRNQADVIHNILHKYHIKMSQVMWFCGDNAIKNPLTSRLMGVPFANCLPHSLNLVMKKFMGVFDVTDCVGLIGQFINMGHSMARRQLLKPFGLKYSWFDWSATRWQGLLESLLKLTENLDQKQDSLRKLIREKNPDAFNDLKEQVQKNTMSYLTRKKKDESTRQRTTGLTTTQEVINDGDDQEEAADDNDDRIDDNEVDDFDFNEVIIETTEQEEEPFADLTRPSVWRQLYHYVLAADTSSKIAIATMAFLSDWRKFSEALLIKHCLQSMPTLMTKTEGGNAYMSKDMVDTIVSDVTFLMNKLKTYKEDKNSRINAVNSVIKVAKEVADQYFKTSEYTDMTSAKTHHQIEADRAEVANFLTNCKGHLLSLLSKACNAVFSKVEGVFVNDHVDTAIQRLKLRQVFSMSSPLPPLDTPSGNEKAIIKFLRPLLPEVRVQKIIGLAHPFDKSSVQTALYEAYLELLHDVNGTTGSAVGLIGKVPNPLEFFQSRFRDTPATQSGKKLLANLAVRALVSPVSSVAAERGGSILHNLSSYDRRKMGTKAMQDNMFLRVNKSYVQRLRAVAVNRVRMRAPKALRITARVVDDESDSDTRKPNASRDTQKRKRRDERYNLQSTVTKKSKVFGTGGKQTTLYRYLADNDDEEEEQDDNDDGEKGGGEEEGGKGDNDDKSVINLAGTDEEDVQEEEKGGREGGKRKKSQR